MLNTNLLNVNIFVTFNVALNLDSRIKYKIISLLVSYSIILFRSTMRQDHGKHVIQASGSFGYLESKNMVKLPLPWITYT